MWYSYTNLQTAVMIVAVPYGSAVPHEPSVSANITDHCLIRLWKLKRICLALFHSYIDIDDILLVLIDPRRRPLRVCSLQDMITYR